MTENLATSETVVIRVGEQERELPAVQLFALARRLRESENPSWHFAECGCCICVHPDRADHTEGWLIGDDGSDEWVSH